jgi:hypothetical protein
MKRADMVRNGAAQLLVAEEALERALMETRSAACWADCGSKAACRR